MQKTVLQTLIVFLCTLTATAQQQRTQPITQSDTSYIDASGTAHVTRVVPVPTTVSPQAQKFLAKQMPDTARHQTIAESRREVAAWQASAGQESLRLYPVHVANGQSIAGVPVRIVTPLHMPEQNRDRVLLNVHGGGFTVDSGSLTETIPIANLTQTKVIAVLYRLAPEQPFPAAVDDTVAVYKELLKTYKPQNIALYGTSAGAVLTPEVAVKLRQLGLPLPGALGVFSGNGDFARRGDSGAIYGLGGFSGPLYAKLDPKVHSPYQMSTDGKNPVLSPLYANLKGFPPTLFISSERDMLLSGTVNLHRAFLNAGVDARLIVFDGLPHAFWATPSLPESKEADRDMAFFFAKELHLATELAPR
jgi:monoterpene epsilon-lactone hydrolase